MQATWLIERDTFSDDNPQRLAEIVKEMGQEAVWFRYPGFDADLTHKPIAEDAPVIVYGSINAAMYIQRHKPWIPGVWCDFKALRCSNYLAYWGKYSIQKEYALLPLAEIPRLKEWLYATFVSDGLIFIRPDDNAKSFHGELVAYEQFDHWFEVANIYNPGETCLSLIARPSKIEAEWRFIIANRSVITGSQYRNNGQLETEAVFDEKAAALADEIAKATDFNPAPVYSMDICRTIFGEYNLIECGSINCSGLYKCDLKKIAQAVSEAAWKEWKELQIN